MRAAEGLEMWEPSKRETGGKRVKSCKCREPSPLLPHENSQGHYVTVEIGRQRRAGSAGRAWGRTSGAARRAGAGSGAELAPQRGAVGTTVEKSIGRTSPLPAGAASFSPPPPLRRCAGFFLFRLPSAGAFAGSVMATRSPSVVVSSLARPALAGGASP